MIHEEEIQSLVHQAIVRIAQGDTRAFGSTLSELESRGWDQSSFFIIEALLRATEKLPSVDPVTTADLTKRITDRFEGALSIRRPAMEAVVRGANGELEVSRGIPRDLSATYAMIVTGQLVHEGLLSADEAIGRSDASDADSHTDPDLVGNSGDEEP